MDTKSRILISDRAHVIFDMHLLADKLEEKRLREGVTGKELTNGEKAGGKEIGTTMKGIGPCYTTKSARCGIRLHQVLDSREEMNRRLRAMAEDMKNRYDGFEGYDVDEEIKRFDVRKWFLWWSLVGNPLMECSGLSGEAGRIQNGRRSHDERSTSSKRANSRGRR